MTAKISLLKPIAITDAMFSSSTVSEADYSAWLIGTTYDIGDRVISTVTHRIYESLRASNLAKDPTDVLTTSGLAPWWLDVDATNKWAMFDGEASTPTVVASPLTVVVTPGPFADIYLGDIDADELVISAKDAPGGTVIFSLTVDLEASAPGDYYEWCYDPFAPMPDYVITDFPPYYTAEVTLTLTKTAGEVSCGILAFGTFKDLADTLKGAKVKPKSFSYVKFDEFGKNKIKRRKKARDLSLTGLLDLEEATTVVNILTDLMDVPCVVVASNLPVYGALRTFGLPSGEVSFDHNNHAVLTFSAEGLI